LIEISSVKAAGKADITSAFPAALFCAKTGFQAVSIILL